MLPPSSQKSTNPTSTIKSMNPDWNLSKFCKNLRPKRKRELKNRNKKSTQSINQSINWWSYQQTAMRITIKTFLCAHLLDAHLEFWIEPVSVAVTYGINVRLQERGGFLEFGFQTSPGHFRHTRLYGEIKNSHQHLKIKFIFSRNPNQETVRTKSSIFLGSSPSGGLMSFRSTKIFRFISRIRSMFFVRTWANRLSPKIRSCKIAVQTRIPPRKDREESLLYRSESVWWDRQSVHEEHIRGVLERGVVEDAKQASHEFRIFRINFPKKISRFDCRITNLQDKKRFKNQFNSQRKKQSKNSSIKCNNISKMGKSISRKKILERKLKNKFITT